MSEVTRRQYLGALAAGAAANWEESDYDIENVEEWGDEIEHVSIGRFTPLAYAGSADLGHSGFSVERRDVTDPMTAVWYNRRGVIVSLEAEWELGEYDAYSGGSADFDPDEARDLAVAIYQAAEELERWREAIDDE